MKQKKPKNILKNVFTLLKYVKQFAPELFVCRFFMIIFRTVVHLMLNFSMIQIVIDCVAQKREFSEMIQFMLIAAVVIAVSEILEQLFEHYINGLAKQKIHKGVHTLILSSVQNIDLEKYDDSDFYNDYIWALERADTEIINSYENVFKLFEYGIQAVTMLSVTMFYDKLILLFVLVPMVINVVIGNYMSKLSYEYEQDVNVIQRKKNYSRRVFYLAQYAKELKLYPVGEVLVKNFRESVNHIMKLYKTYGLKTAALGFLNEISREMIGVVLLCLYMAYRAAVQGLYTAGTCAAMLNAANSMGFFLNMIFNVFPKIKKNGMFAEKIIRIIEYESEIENFVSDTPMDKEFKQITWKNVSFRYPKASEPVLKNINFTLQKGEKIAIVGRNGSGKTTLIKLLMRYYDATDGEIFYNDTNVKELTTKDYRQLFATVFQDFQIYALKLLENIGMHLTEKVDKALAEEALERSHLQELKDKLACNLTKEFDNKGLVLSGGQQQKTAIARCFYRDSEIVIMDEASSALDPISEHEINETIVKGAKDKTMVIISHRLSTIQHVDKIYYMEEGQVLESGTHEELMQQNGKYAEMYNIQAEAYRGM